MANHKYQVVVWYKDGTSAMLTHLGKTAWTLKTARKHLAELVTARDSGKMWQDVRTFTLVLL